MRSDCASMVPPHICSTTSAATTPQPEPEVAAVVADKPQRFAATTSRWTNALYIFPYLVVYAALLVYPLFKGMWLSLHKADFFGARTFVGFENFERLFSDHIFLGTVWNTFYFILLTVPALALIGLGLALALNRQTRTAAFLR